MQKEITETSVAVFGTEDGFSRTLNFVVASPPTWRDIWSIIRGRYIPWVRVITEEGLAYEENALCYAEPSPRMYLKDIAGSIPLTKKERKAMAKEAWSHRQKEHPAKESITNALGKKYFPPVE